jgi:hypothetical protein
MIALHSLLCIPRIKTTRTHHIYFFPPGPRSRWTGGVGIAVGQSLSFGRQTGLDLMTFLFLGEPGRGVGGENIIAL